MILDQNAIFSEFKGALTENYCLQSLLPLTEPSPRYWKDAKHKVDFLLQHDDVIIPVEVKSGRNVRSTSLKQYGEIYKPPLMLRFSMQNLSMDGNILNVPLFLIDCLPRLLELAQKP